MLNQGLYVIAKQEDDGLYRGATGSYSITMMGDVRDATMDVDGFGLIGGALLPTDAIGIHAGTLVVAANGAASYSAG